MSEKFSPEEQAFLDRIGSRSQNTAASSLAQQDSAPDLSVKNPSKVVSKSDRSWLSSLFRPRYWAIGFAVLPFILAGFFLYSVSRLEVFFGSGLDFILSKPESRAFAESTLASDNPWLGTTLALYDHQSLVILGIFGVFVPIVIALLAIDHIVSRSK